MKLIRILVIIAIAMGTAHADAQILKKLKKKFENMTEKVITPNGDDMQIGETEKNLELVKGLYPTDLRIKITENGKPGNTIYIDADKSAIRIETPNGEKPQYIDGTGYRYYDNSGYVKMQNGENFEMLGIEKPWTIPDNHKLPKLSEDQFENPINTPNLANKELLEWAYNYTPSDFRNSDLTKKFYRNTTMPLNILL